MNADDERFFRMARAEAAAGCVAAIRDVDLFAPPRDGRDHVPDVGNMIAPAPGKTFIEFRPKVVCLVGSTRFRAAYEQAFRDEEHAGRICLTVPCFKDDPCCKTPEEQARLDALHRRKLELCDEVLVLNVGGYTGSSTRSEITYAARLGKPVRFLEPGARNPDARETTP